uniref:IF rod domain-containing protein n=1 Tax=Myotis lucifugus TaxID=59463 RepID=G1QF13_MYOLU
MSFSTHASFSTNYWTLGSMQSPSHSSSMTSVYASSGSQISVPLHQHLEQGPEGIGSIQREKETVQCLNDHLSYLERVRSLEADNRLKSKMQEHLEKTGSQVRGWRHYFKIIDLRAQIFASSADNACIILQIDNACLAAEDLRLKYEMELAMRQSVESDINGLQKVDDIDITWLQLDTEIEAVKGELVFMKKNHNEEENGL